MKNANRALAAKLAKLRAGYANAESGHQAFNHFYCPILFRDEDVPLCKAHIVNQVFPNSSKAWTVQRRDVDNFYGSTFEADFTALKYARGRTCETFEIFADKRLYRNLAPRILLGGEPVDFFFPNNRQVPPNYTLTIMEHDGKMVNVGLKMSPADVTAAVDGNWQFEISLDARIAAVVSLLKAAHLTLFEMLGYRYIFSSAGEFLGRQILGKFFLKNFDKPKVEVTRNARLFFAEFINMVRPVLSPSLPFLGTITDNKMLFCRASSGFFWAFIVYIKTDDILHAVMLPVWDRVDLIPTFFDFLRNKNEDIVVSGGQHQQDGWVIQKQEIPIFWPKAEIL